MFIPLFGWSGPRVSDLQLISAGRTLALDLSADVLVAVDSNKIKNTDKRPREFMSLLSNTS